MKNEEEFLQQVAQEFGITLNGDKPYDIQVHSPEVYKMVVKNGSLGLGEAYIKGLWDCEDLSELFYKVTSVHGNEIAIKKNLRLLLFVFKHKLFNFQSVKRSVAVCDQHYNLGNELYNRMLDRELNYSCAYWKNADNLDDAQKAKLDLICRKMHLKPGMRVLDVGCGWGSFARYAAKHYGVDVTGITISKEQINYANQHIGDLPIRFLMEDYREFKAEPFDRIISIGMFEHVGIKNYQTYFRHLKHLLKDDGLFLLHTIGTTITAADPDPWIEKYIFPNSKLPSMCQISKSIEKHFCLEDLHNFGADYDKTLMAWYHNFVAAWPEIKHHYDDEFYRIWTYYLLTCAGTFRSRTIHLWQLVLSKYGVLGGYEPVR